MKYIALSKHHIRYDIVIYDKYHIKYDFIYIAKLSYPLPVFLSRDPKIV